MASTSALEEGRSGVFKRRRVCGRIGEGLFFWVGASGFQDVSQDNGLGKGWPVPQYRKVSLTIGHYGWSQMSIA